MAEVADTRRGVELVPIIAHLWQKMAVAIDKSRIVRDGNDVVLVMRMLGHSSVEVFCVGDDASEEEVERFRLSTSTLEPTGKADICYSYVGANKQSVHTHPTKMLCALWPSVPKWALSRRPSGP